MNFLLPTRINELGRILILQSVSKHFLNGNLLESGAYLGLPLVTIAALYAHSNWGEELATLLLECLIFIVILSLGPSLHLAGHSYPFTMPWWAFAKMPVLDNAFPVRFLTFGFLILGLIVSLWLANDRINAPIRVVLAAGVILFSLPKLSADFWGEPIHNPPFFGSKAYQRYLSGSKTVLILPYEDSGDAMLWQAQSSMYFAMAQGGSGPRPVEFYAWPMVGAFERQSYVPRAAEQLRAFLRACGVDTVIVTDRLNASMQPLLSTLGGKPTEVGGVWLYRVPARQPNQMLTLTEARALFDSDRLITMIYSANMYLNAGGSLESLSVIKTKDIGLLPESSLVGPPSPMKLGAEPEWEVITDPRLAYGIWLGKTSDGRIGIGEFVWYPASGPLIERLSRVAGDTYFPYPDRFLPSPRLSKRKDYGWMFMLFTRAQLAQAAELLKTHDAPGPPREVNSSTLPPRIAASE